MTKKRKVAGNMNLSFKSVRSASYITAVLISLNPAPSSAADTLFLSDRVIRMELRTDFSAIQAERTGTPSYHEGTLTYRSKGSKPVILPVRVMARGNFRLKPANCSFPPLMIDFDTANTANTLFENQDKLKLVTPCQDEEEVIREYIIYRMYNLVTDRSFKVRLAKISYYDETTNERLYEKFSFLLENREHVAARSNAGVIKNNVSSSEINSENYRKLGVFQYLIGNLDWHVALGKNIEVIKDIDHPSELYAVPYDFDFSAFVNAEYSKPIGGKEDILTERRRYIGGCYTDEEFSRVFDFYRELKQSFEAIIKDQKILEWEVRKEMLDFLNLFYDLADDPELVIKEFNRGCR